MDFCNMGNVHLLEYLNPLMFFEEINKQSHCDNQLFLVMGNRINHVFYYTQRTFLFLCHLILIFDISY